MKRKLPVLAITLTLVGLAGSSAVLAQGPQPRAAQVALGTTFTYQGQLKQNDSPVTGSCSSNFKLFDAASGGAQKGPTLSPALSVLNGLFTTQLDFGKQFTGDARWVELTVDCGGGLVTLSPRQALAAAPYALGLLPGAQISGSIQIFSMLQVDNYSTGAGVQGNGNGGGYGVVGTTSGSGFAGVYGNTAGANNGVYGQANNSTGSGVWGQNTGSGAGVAGSSGSGYGVDGSTTSGYAGVKGSTTGAQNQNGVYGYANNSGGSGVYGRNDGSGIGIAGTSGSGGTGVYGLANGANSRGVYGESNGGFGVQGQSTSGPIGFAFRADGHAQQSVSEGGWVKAMAYVDPYIAGTNNEQIGRCFNSQASGATVATPPCGFTYTKFGVGVYGIDFGFTVFDRFLSVMPWSSGTSPDLLPGGTNLWYVAIKRSSDGTAADNRFNIFVY